MYIFYTGLISTADNSTDYNIFTNIISPFVASFNFCINTPKDGILLPKHIGAVSIVYMYFIVCFYWFNKLALWYVCFRNVGDMKR
jgi:hypothetical protein